MNELQNQIDRLVDGELALPDRQKLLARLDSEPTRWRDCALAFLESQSLRTMLRDVVASEAVSASTSMSETSAPKPAPQHRTTQRLGQWLAIAASLALAFWAGNRLTGSAANQGTGPELAVVPHSPQLVKTVDEGARPRTSHDPNVLTLWTVGRDGQRQSLSVPLVEAAWIDEQLAPQLASMVSDDVRDQLRDRGYDVESRFRYAPLVVDDGQSYLLPVEDTRIVRSTLPIY